MPAPANPFQVTTLPTASEFADRKREVARLRTVFATPGQKLVVYGDRRQGKTAAMDVAAAKARTAKHPVVIVNLATAVDSQDAVRRLVGAVQGAVGKSWKTAMQDIAAKIRVTLTLTPGRDGPVPSLSFGVDPGGQGPRPTLFIDALNAIEEELARKRLTLGLGLDEFQRLLAWGGEDFEWALKAVLERHRRISYVLAGSARAMIEQMVTDKHRALWKAVDTLALGPIPEAEFAHWLGARARASGVPFHPQTPKAILRLAGPRTRDVLLLAHYCWEDARTHRDGGRAERALDTYVDETSALHQQLWERAPESDRERRILRALAADPKLEPTSGETRARYHLGAPSSVARGLSGLVQRELLARSGSRYVFDDPFFRRWVERNALADLGLAPPAVEGRDEE